MRTYDKCVLGVLQGADDLLLVPRLSRGFCPFVLFLVSRRRPSFALPPSSPVPFVRPRPCRVAA
eukprot:1347600-Pyramimonas_sp.AAC.1